MTRRTDLCPERPLTIAHRAGNELQLIQQARSIGTDLVEADIWRYRGHLEVRHFKTMGAVPVLWDRWALARGWTPRLTLAGLLRAIQPGDPELLLDLKGTDPALPGEVAAAMERFHPGTEYSVCSQTWPLLEPFRDLPHVRSFHSIGNQQVLAALLSQPPARPFEAISIHRKLLTPTVVRALFELVPLVTSWPVNTATILQRLQSWGINGFTSDSLELLSGISPGRTHIDGSL